MEEKNKTKHQLPLPVGHQPNGLLVYVLPKRHNLTGFKITYESVDAGGQAQNP